MSEKQKTKPRSRWKSIGVNSLLFLMVYLGVSFFLAPALPKGKLAPTFHLRGLDGKMYDLESYKGRQVILHFWATWCGVCKTNLYSLRLINAPDKSDPVFLSIVQDPKNVSKIQKIQKQHSLRYPILFAEPSTLRNYQVSRFPSTFFLSKKGKVILTDSGLISPFGLWWRAWWVWLRS